MVLEIWYCFIEWNFCELSIAKSAHSLNVSLYYTTYDSAKYKIKTRDKSGHIHSEYRKEFSNIDCLLSFFYSACIIHIVINYKHMYLDLVVILLHVVTLQLGSAILIMMVVTKHITSIYRITGIFVNEELAKG